MMLTLSASSPWVYADGASLYPPREAERLVAFALKNNPALASSRLDAEAAHAWAHHHNTLESPELAVDFFQAPVSGFPNPLKRQEEIDYSVSQKIPFPGKLGSMASAEHWRGAAAGKRSEGVERTVRRDVLTAYAEGYAAEWEIRLLRENRDEMYRLSQTLKSGYMAGRGRQSDWLRAESEVARLDAERLKAEAMRREARAMMAENLGIESLAGLGGFRDSVPTIPMAFADSLTPPHLPATANPESLKRTALETSPGLAAMQMELSMADAEYSAARKEAWPDFMVRGMYKDMRNEMDDTWSLMVGMTAPIAPWSWKGVRQGTRRARLLREKAGRDYAMERQRLASELEQAMGDVESASGRLRLTSEQRIPLAARMAQSVQTEYRQGLADFNDLIMSLSEMRMAREEYHRAASDHLKAWANLEWITGDTLSKVTEETP